MPRTRLVSLHTKRGIPAKDNWLQQILQDIPDASAEGDCRDFSPSPKRNRFCVFCEWPQKGLSRKTDRDATRGERTQLYQLVTVIQDHLDFKSLTVTGKLYKQFQLKKAGGRLAWLFNP